MRIFYCGFNGFNQWETSKKSNYSFKEVNLLNFQIDKVTNFDIHIGWSHNLILLNSKVYIRGFHLDDIADYLELVNPNNDKIAKVTFNEEFLLLYNNDHVWKYYLDPEVDQKWKKLPNFIKVDCRLNEGNEKSGDDEFIEKIVSGDRINVALTSYGRLFNVPYEINFQCPGKIIDIECGYEHCILLTDLGNVYTWGGGSRCQLGHGNTRNHDEPELVEALAGVKITKIAAGGWHCCAISEHGDLYTWGWNEKGQIGIFIDKEENNICESVKNAFDDVASSSDNLRKKIKRNNEVLPNYALPMLIDIYDSENCIVETNIVDVSCGSKHTVLKLEDGSIWGTGYNKYGQLGFDPGEFESVQSFKKLNVVMQNIVIKCGAWATALMVDDSK